MTGLRYRVEDVCAGKIVRMGSALFAGGRRRVNRGGDPGRRGDGAVAFGAALLLALSLSRRQWPVMSLIVTSVL
jgi:hypothetical protein